MKIMIVGGTGFLGYYTAKCALADGHTVSAIAIEDVELGDWYPKEIDVSYCDVFTTSEDELVKRLKGYDALVYSVGPDDRVTPPAPAYKFFSERLVEHCATVFRAARKAGVKRAVCYNSYFAYFDREYPEKKLAEYHPYIRCRVEQAQRLIDESEGKMDVMILELPYIFGSMPGRLPLWKDVYIERFFRAPSIFFPRGGTTMINVVHIGEAGLGALKYGKAGERYPIGDENHTFKQMIDWMQEGLGINKRVLQPGKRICAMGANAIAKQEKRHGNEAGLNMKRLMLDIMGEELYIPEEVINRVSSELKYGRGGVHEGILDTMKACYPNGF